MQKYNDRIIISVKIIGCDLLVEKLSNIILSKLEKDNAINGEIVEAYQYGIQILIINTIGVVISLILGLLMSSLFQTIVFLLSFTITRRYCGGYHTDALWKCLLTTSCMIILILLINRYFIFSKTICTFISISSIIIFAFFAPVENDNKPLENYFKKRNKIISLLILIIQCIIGYVLLLFNIRIYKIVFISIMCISFFILISVLKERSKKNEKSIKNNCESLFESG